MTAGITLEAEAGSTATVLMYDTNTPVLILHLDQVTVTVHPTATPDGRAVLAQFCTQLAVAAGQVAALLDTGPETTPDWRF